jgi:hypothetical protein
MRKLKQILDDSKSQIPVNKIAQAASNAYEKLKAGGDLETYQLTIEEIIRRYGNSIPFNVLDPYGWDKLQELIKKHDADGTKFNLTPNISYDDAWALIDELELG